MVSPLMLQVYFPLGKFPSPSLPGSLGPDFRGCRGRDSQLKLKLQSPVIFQTTSLFEHRPLPAQPNAALTAKHGTNHAPGSPTPFGLVARFIQAGSSELPSLEKSPPGEHWNVDEAMGYKASEAGSSKDVATRLGAKGTAATLPIAGSAQLCPGQSRDEPLSRRCITCEQALTPSYRGRSTSTMVRRTAFAMQLLTISHWPWIRLVLGLGGDLHPASLGVPLLLCK